MRRFRVLFAVCALALLAPLAFLVRRAIYSVALDGQLRHQAVAERIFDEMEGSLSLQLEREEARPFERFEEADTAPFVVGAFQIEPSGAVLSWPQAGFRELPGDLSLQRFIVEHWRDDADAASPQSEAVAQSPGTTVMLRGAEAKAGGLRVEEPAASNAYDALRLLNKAVEERGERKQRAAVEQFAKPSDRRFESDRRGMADGRLAQAAPPSPPSPRSSLSPMTGRLIDARYLMLYRTVLRAREGYRQGVVIDLDTLGNWLRARALGDDGLAEHAEVTFWSAPKQPPALSADDRYVYQHRFAEPFDDLTARLVLRPLPGVGSATYVYALSALLIVLGGLGLAALYRMVSVTVRFAERRSNFVAAVSHELKTPLTAIRMYAEMLRDGLVASEAKRDEYYRHITIESERLSRLINNVLELGRLEQGQRAVAVSAGQVEPVLRDVADLLRPHVEREGFELVVEAEPGLPPIRFDRDALVQVLCNLVDNAVKYARDASPRRIVLRAGRDGGAVGVAVRDHGSGVAARQLARIFEPFYRIESELTRRHKGTGIGLALVRGLAEQMGAVAVARNLADGFEVELRFPT